MLIRRDKVKHIAQGTYLSGSFYLEAFLKLLPAKIF